MRPNNFDLTRLILASIVCIFHSGMLSHAPKLAWSTYLDAGAAVEGFFAISGCLIFASWDRSASLREYASKRWRRILPGYFAATVLCLAISFLLFHAFRVGKFFVANATFLNFLYPGIEGVFANNPESTGMNGALWTIRVEIMFYCAVPVVAWLCRKLGRDRVLITTAIASILYRYVMEGRLFLHLPHRALAVALPGQWSFFAVGALVYYHLDWFRKHVRLLFVLGLSLYAATYFVDGLAIRPLAIPVMVLAFCFLAPGVKGPARWGDFSYGTYLFHWPIIQTLVAFGLFARWPYLALGVTVALVAFSAGLSWFFVEKPMLRGDNYKSRAAVGPIRA
jgi:peptidoglycan/LPS O-acetylase OafA/YrhL